MARNKFYSETRVISDSENCIVLSKIDLRSVTHLHRRACPDWVGLEKSSEIRRHETIAIVVKAELRHPARAAVAKIDNLVRARRELGPEIPSNVTEDNEGNEDAIDSKTDFVFFVAFCLIGSRKNHPRDSVLEHGFMEIDEQTDRDIE
jgi:hypothetical protein